MKYQRSGSAIAGRLERGEDAVESLLRLVAENADAFGRATGIGAVDDVEFSIFDTATRQFTRTSLKEPLELTMLMGIVGRMHGRPYNHLHATFGRADGSVVGGHLDRAVVSGTVEFVVDLLPFDIGRSYDAEVGLNLLDFP